MTREDNVKRWLCIFKVQSKPRQDPRQESGIILVLWWPSPCGVGQQQLRSISSWHTPCEAQGWLHKPRSRTLPLPITQERVTGCKWVGGKSCAPHLSSHLSPLRQPALLANISIYSHLQSNSTKLPVQRCFLSHTFIFSLISFYGQSKCFTVQLFLVSQENLT